MPSNTATNFDTKSMASKQQREYDLYEIVVFRKTKEKFGGLSNMAADFPLRVNDVSIRTSEALYQACRFPHLPEIQRAIIAQKSPMTAKMKSKPHRKESRADWNRVRVNIMRWCLRVKLVQNWDAFSRLLLDTANMPIVEFSRRDRFWGAKALDENTLVGMNVLGRLLMELRDEVRNEKITQQSKVDSPNIPEFLLYLEPIVSVGADCPVDDMQTRLLRARFESIVTEQPHAIQESL